VLNTASLGEGFLEDGWLGRTLTVGGVTLRIDQPCPRCVMTTLPQADLPKGQRRRLRRRRRARTHSARRRRGIDLIRNECF
jgi:uncharacterized protein YcbX